MRGHIDLCTARLDLMEGKFNTALDALEKIVEINQFAGKHLNSTALAIDRLFALSGTSGDMNPPTEIGTLDLSALNTLDPDERLVALTMLVQLSDRYSGALDATLLRERLQDATVDYEKYENQLLASVAPWL